MQKSDLDQIGKLVRRIVREELEAEGRNIKDVVEHEVRTANLHIREEIHQQADRIKNLEVRLQE